MGLKVDYNTVGNIPFQIVKQQIANQLYWEYYKQCLNVPNNKMIEDDKNHGVPMMNEVFYSMYSVRHVIPSWTAFIDEYMNKYVIFCKNGQLTFRHRDSRFHYLFDERPLEKKLLRAYMSFLKEAYMLHWFFDKGMTSAYWSLETDIAGYDIVIVNEQNNIYGIKIYSKTNAAIRFAEIKKTTRNKLLKNSRSISVRASLDERFRIGDTYTFDEHILRCVYNYIAYDIEPCTIRSGKIEPGIIL